LIPLPAERLSLKFDLWTKPKPKWYESTALALSYLFVRVTTLSGADLYFSLKGKFWIREFKACYKTLPRSVRKLVGTLGW